MRTGIRHAATGNSKKAKVLGCALFALLLALYASAEAQQPKKAPRIGFVSVSGDPNTPGPNVVAFQRGLRDLGYIDGKNIHVEYRYVEGKRDRTPGLVGELVELKVDVLRHQSQDRQTDRFDDSTERAGACGSGD